MWIPFFSHLWRYQEIAFLLLWAVRLSIIELIIPWWVISPFCSAGQPDPTHAQLKANLTFQWDIFLNNCSAYYNLTSFLIPIKLGQLNFARGELARQTHPNFIASYSCISDFCLKSLKTGFPSCSHVKRLGDWLLLEAGKWAFRVWGGNHLL